MSFLLIMKQTWVMYHPPLDASHPSCEIIRGDTSCECAMFYLLNFGSNYFLLVIL